MSLKIQEMLDKNNSLRIKAQEAWSNYEQNGGARPEVSLETFDTVEKMILNSAGNFDKGRVTIRETLMSNDTVKLIPKVIEGKLREAAEPAYLASRFMKTLQVDKGSSTVYVVPIVGEVIAHEVTEGQRYQESYPEMNTANNAAFEIRVKKIGCKVTITEEAISDGSWDMLGISISKMGRAMARYKEEWCMNEFSTHGHIIFDNSLRQQMPSAGTSGRAADGSYNDTLSTEDFIDMVLAMMGNDRVPTDIIMHPLTWVIFARNSMIGNGLTYGAFGGQQVHPWGATQGTPGFAGLASEQGDQKYILKPEQVQGRLPMPLRINFSPFVRFDKSSKKFDMYVLDANEVGVILQKDALTTDNWTDPERDIRLLKCKERYGVGIQDNGKGICVAKNLAVATTYPTPPVVSVVTKEGN